MGKHYHLTDMPYMGPDDHWTVDKYTDTAPTDAYGTIEFQGGAHPNKAQVCHTECLSAVESLVMDPTTFSVEFEL